MRYGTVTWHAWTWPFDSTLLPSSRGRAFPTTPAVLLVGIQLRPIKSAKKSCDIYFLVILPVIEVLEFLTLTNRYIIYVTFSARLRTRFLMLCLLIEGIPV
jgi:hypothetical protein